MKGTAWICLLLTLILALMGAQALILRQKTQALEATLTKTLEELTAMQTSMSSHRPDERDDQRPLQPAARGGRPVWLAQMKRPLAGR